MLLLIARIIAIILALLVISKTYLDYRKQNENRIMLIFWIIVWLGVIAVAAYPDMLEIIIVHSGRTGLGTVFGLAVVFILFLVYRVYIKSNRIERQMTRMVRELGLKNINKDEDEKL